MDHLLYIPHSLQRIHTRTFAALVRADHLPCISDIDTGIFIKTCLAQYFLIKDKQPVELCLVVTAITKADDMVADSRDQLKPFVGCNI